MSNQLRVPNTSSYITWRKGTCESSGQEVLHLIVRDINGKHIAKAKLTAEQLHTYICMHNTMK